MRPARPFFSSGPCAKRPGWTPEALKGALVGRSHRSKPGKAKLKDAIERTKKLLGLPAGYRLGIVPASDTGAVEMALWSMLGARPVDLFAWESFSEDWVTDTVKQLKLKDARVFKAAYGELPDLEQYDPTHDAVFVWNGTTSGVKVPNGDWIPDGREGLTICDATSAAFAMDLPWEKLDVTTFSWQKVLGGEAAHGMLDPEPPRRGAAGKLHPALAAAQDFPHDQGRQDRGRHFRRRDHQHPVHGGGGRLSRRPDLGRKPGRPESADRALQRQSACAGKMGGEFELGRFPGQGCRHPLQHQRLHRRHRSGLHRPERRGQGRT